MSDAAVVVVGRNYNTTLGLVKSLGEAGFSCEVVSCVNRLPKHRTPDVLSKYVTGYFYAVSRDDEDIVAKVMRFADKDRKKVLLPADDYSTALFDLHADEISPFFIFPQAAGQAGGIVRLMDKAYQKKIAAFLGIKAAGTWKIALGDTIEVPDDLTFPCFVKPIDSFDIPECKTLIKKCDDMEALNAHLKLSKEKGLTSILAEEYIPFTEEFTVPGAAVDTDIIIPAYIKKLKTARGKHRGVTKVGEVREIDAGLRRKLQEFVNAAGFRGLFDVEVLKSGDDYYFNEINLRVSAAGYAVTAAGVNLPGIFASFCLKKPWKELMGPVRFGTAFVNEKAVIDEYNEGLCAWKKAVSDIRNADVRFLTDRKDPEACKAFYRIMAGIRKQKLKDSVKAKLNKPRVG